VDNMTTMTAMTVVVVAVVEADHDITTGTALMVMVVVHVDVEEATIVVGKMLGTETLRIKTWYTALQIQTQVREALGKAQWLRGERRESICKGRVCNSRNPIDRRTSTTSWCLGTSRERR